MKKTIKLFFVTVCAVTLFVGCAPTVETDLLECDAATMTQFPYNENGVMVEKYQTSTPVAEHPGMVKIETFYVNKGNLSQCVPMRCVVPR